MRTFDHVDSKLAETDFFLKRMAAVSYELFEMRCYFSAFVSSSRSVTFAMQASMKGIPGFSEWYQKRQEELRDNNIARFFAECRTDDQKLGFNHIVAGIFDKDGSKFFFGEPEKNRYKFIPKSDVLATCKSHMNTVCGIVDRAYQDFGLEIDPNQIYTPEGMSKLGLSLEEIEARVGLPRGYTDIDWPHNDKDFHRLALLRRQIPGSQIKHILVEYLGRDLCYPIGPYRVRAD